MTNFTDKSTSSQQHTEKKEFKKHSTVCINRIAFQHPNLNNTQKILHGIISSLTEQRGYCYASIQYLAFQMDATEDHVRSDIRVLQKYGLLEVVGRSPTWQIFDRTMNHDLLDNSKLSTGETEKKPVKDPNREISRNEPRNISIQTEKYPDSDPYTYNCMRDTRGDGESTPPKKQYVEKLTTAEQKLLRDNMPSDWLIDGMDDWVAEAWLATPKQDSQGWELKNTLVGFVRTLKKLKPYVTPSNRKNVLEAFKSHLEGHLFFKENMETLQGKSQFHSLEEWFKNKSWEDGIAEALGMKTVADWKKLKKPKQEKTKTIRNHQTGKDEKIVNRALMLDRYDHAEIANNLLPFISYRCETIEQAHGVIDVFCKNERKDFDFVLAEIQKQYGITLKSDMESEENERVRGAIPETVGPEITTTQGTRNKAPRQFGEMFKGDSQPRESH